MSLLGSIIGVDIGGIISAGIPAALTVFQQNSALQIAQANLQAQQTQAATAAAAQATNDGQLRLIITGGLVLGGAVLAIRALRK